MENFEEGFEVVRGLGVLQLMEGFEGVRDLVV